MTITRMAGFCSCKTCTSTVRGGRLRVLSRHGWLYGVSMVDASGSCLGLVQPLSRTATSSACLDNFFLLTGQQ